MQRRAVALCGQACDERRHQIRDEVRPVRREERERFVPHSVQRLKHDGHACRRWVISGLCQSPHSETQAAVTHHSSGQHLLFLW